MSDDGTDHLETLGHNAANSQRVPHKRRIAGKWVPAVITVRRSPNQMASEQGRRPI